MSFRCTTGLGAPLESVDGIDKIWILTARLRTGLQPGACKRFGKATSFSISHELLQVCFVSWRGPHHFWDANWWESGMVGVVLVDFFFFVQVTRSHTDVVWEYVPSRVEL